MKLLFCGSFKFLDEMKELSEELSSAGFECFLPKFSLGDFSSKKIEEMKDSRKKNGLKNGELEKIIEVKKWFYDRLKDCDAMLVFDKDGYVGLSAAAEIGAAYVLNKPVFFLELPKDYGIRAMLDSSENFKTVPIGELLNKLIKKVVINKKKCREIALMMKNFSFEHPEAKIPEAKLEVQDLEEELFYLFIVVAICHQINWNFLMKALKRIQEDYPSKFTPLYMQSINDEEIFDWLSAYPKKWRLEKRFKRGELVRDMCRLLTQRYKGRVENLLETSGHKMGGKEGLYALLEDFKAYGEDPLSKKSAVFIDLIDRFNLWKFDDWQNYIPPIDYHITRTALRNGIVEINDPKLLEKLENNLLVTQGEDTMIRSAVILAFNEMTKVSNRHSKDLQGFYWALGRECCDPDKPRCISCKNPNCSVPTYMNVTCEGKCPLAHVCEAAKNKNLLKIKEQNFVTTFY